MTYKKILIGLTGGIACYKIPILIRRLKELGHEVRVVMTQSSLNFITELTLQAISGNPVATQLMDEEQEAGMGHIALARWADAIVVAPATANFIAQLAIGLCPDLLTTLCIATQAPILVAPAMNQQMWQNKATIANVEQLKVRGIQILGPDIGLQACGENGPGRMLEPEVLVELICKQIQQLAPSPPVQILTNRHVVITAGPTVEDIDPARFISNRSSGKMGYAIAQAARESGAKVTLISGPVNLPPPSGVHLIKVRTALEMHKAALENLGDIFIGTAAVADFRCKEVSLHKIKKVPGQEIKTLELIPNLDIIASVSSLENRPFCVGFAAESQHAYENGIAKLKAKNLDMIAINNILDAGVGFEGDTNAITLVWPQGEENFPVQAKQLLATKLINKIGEYYFEKYTTQDC